MKQAQRSQASVVEAPVRDNEYLERGYPLSLRLCASGFQIKRSRLVHRLTEEMNGSCVACFSQEEEVIMKNMKIYCG